MCILCVVQKWSRRIATMLPWLVIPLIGLWALSQLLPPGLRFEVTSPRLACVLVLLVTLFWYEILMPQLSAWRVRRSARLRERKRFEAIEMQKLRKTATRRCRNCLTAYRDQNPGGGRFMCSYCGHISKRPVIDIPGPAGLGITNSGIIGELVGKGGKIWNGKVWSDSGLICGQDWLENENWVVGSFTGKSSYWGKNGGGFFSGDDHCVAEKSYSGAVVFACNLLTPFFWIIKWLWRKIFRVSSASEDDSSDAEQKGMSQKGETGLNFLESKGEKARRKAEEKRQARIERELLEEEERKQREEVARLVEERRRLRDENMEAEKERGKGSIPDGEKDSKREAERKRMERRKEKDKGSNKSNSDGEELERRAGRESERKREFDKRNDIERRELQKNGTESVKAQSLEMGHGIKGLSTNNFSRVNAGTRYLDHMKGSFLSSSKAFSGGSFFGKGAHTSATVVSKENKSTGSVDHAQASANKREVHQAEQMAGKLTLSGDDKVFDSSVRRPVVSESQPWTTPKKSWQQLFTRSPAVPPSSTANVISRPIQKPQAEGRSPQLSGQASTPHPLDNPIHFGLSLPFTIPPFPKETVSSGLVSTSAAEPIFPFVGELPHEFIPEETELFEDPCYVPDPVSLLGPVSESLDNFSLDLGTGIATDTGLYRPCAVKNVSASAEVNRPSPIESPISRLRVTEERHATSNQFPCTPKTQDLHTSLMDVSNNANEQGTWQMWGTSPLGQDGLGLLGGPASWLLPLAQNKPNQEDIVYPSPQNAMISQYAVESQVLSGTCSPQKGFLGNFQNGGTFSPVGPGPNDGDPWLQKTVLQPLSGDGENHFPPLDPQQDISRNEMTYGSPIRSATSHPFEPSAANCWPKKDWPMHGSGEGIGNSSVARPHIGGLFSTPDVQSLWSFN